MNQELDRQEKFWDSEIQDFDAIYSHRKSRFSNWLDAKFRWDMYARFEYTMEHSAPMEGRSFLDVGCGTGRFVLEFLRQGASRVVGIDISENMLEISRKRALEEQLDDRCQFLHTDLLQYQPDAKFDVCIGIGLFDYIRNPLPILTKMQKVTGESIIITLPRFWTWRAPVRKARLALKGCDVFFYTEKQIDSLLKQAGFTSYTFDKIGQLYCVTACVKSEGA